MRTMRMEREDIENSLKVLSHIVDDDFIITVDEARKIIRIDGETIEALQAQLPKRGEWIWENYCWHCSACGENPTRGMGYVQGKNELFRVCPNCGAKMNGEQNVE